MRRVGGKEGGGRSGEGAWLGAAKLQGPEGRGQGREKRG